MLTIDALRRSQANSSEQSEIFSIYRDVSNAPKHTDIREEKNIPVLFVAGTQPVQDGLVNSLKHPGGNLTGTRAPETIPKVLEWLLEISPEVRRVFLPYNPDDEVSLVVLSGLDERGAPLVISLVYREVYSVAVEGP